jgi:hypothetical protein
MTIPSYSISFKTSEKWQAGMMEYWVRKAPLIPPFHYSKIPVLLQPFFFFEPVEDFLHLWILAFVPHFTLLNICKMLPTIFLYQMQKKIKSLFRSLEFKSSILLFSLERKGYWV